MNTRTLLAIGGFGLLSQSGCEVKTIGIDGWICRLNEMDYRLADPEGYILTAIQDEKTVTMKSLNSRTTIEYSPTINRNDALSALDECYDAFQQKGL